MTNEKLLDFITDAFVATPHLATPERHDAYKEIVAALRATPPSSEPINDATATGLVEHLRKARAFAEGLTDQLEQADYCAATLPSPQPSSDALPPHQHGSDGQPVPSSDARAVSLEAAVRKIMSRRCTNPKPVGDSACECCTHHWHALSTLPAVQNDTPAISPHPDTLWVVWFEDATHGHEVFFGPGAEDGARRRYEQAKDNWSCHLLVRVPESARSEKPQPPVSESRKTLLRALEIVAKGEEPYSKVPKEVRQMCGETAAALRSDGGSNQIADLIPNSWLDPLLSGPDAVLNGAGPYTGTDIENLLRAIRKRCSVNDNEAGGKR